MTTPEQNPSVVLFHLRLSCYFNHDSTAFDVDTDDNIACSTIWGMLLSDILLASVASALVSSKVFLLPLPVLDPAMPSIILHDFPLLIVVIILLSSGDQVVRSGATCDQTCGLHKPAVAWCYSASPTVLCVLARIVAIFPGYTPYTLEKSIASEKALNPGSE